MHKTGLMMFEFESEFREQFGFPRFRDSNSKLLSWSCRESNSGPEKIINEPSTCLVSL